MAMQILALPVLQADMNLLQLCSRLNERVELSKVPRLSWSPWIGLELKCVPPSESTAEQVCVCLNRVSIPLHIHIQKCFLR